jgi:hypothetical protein
VAGHEGKIFIDLCDKDWRAVEVDESGWRLIENPPVRFRRAKGMLPLPEQTRGGSVAQLRRFWNVTDCQWPLAIGWQVATYCPHGPYAILKLLGEQGSAKTTNAEVTRKNIDPNVAPLRRPPRTERDLMIAAANSWIVGYDNLSYIDPQLSDGLCCLSSGGGFATRLLYTDDDETILVAERPILLNGIEDMATRSDLLDRCIILVLPRIEPGRRRDEQTFWREYADAQPGIFGALLDAASTALRNLPEVKQRKGIEWPRMVDFAQWVTAAEPALGLRDGDFIRAYQENRADANQTALESSPVVTALLEMLHRNRTYSGKATELLGRIAIGQDTHAKAWPKNARALSGILNRLAPNLRAVGIVIDQLKNQVWRIELGTAAPVIAKTQNSQKSDPVPSPPGPMTLTQQLEKMYYFDNSKENT